MKKETFEKLRTELEDLFPNGEIGDIGDDLRALQAWLLELLVLLAESE